MNFECYKMWSAHAKSTFRSAMRMSRRTRHRWVLAGLLLVAATLRMIGVNWDDAYHLHPDERFLAMVLNVLELPSGAGEFLNESASPMNPRNKNFAFFAYGTLPVTVAKMASIALDRDAYGGAVLVGRTLSGLFDLGTVVLVWLWAGLLLRDRRYALVAAALYAFSVTAIQHSHFFVVDPFANFFIQACLVSLTWHQLRGGRAALALAGLAWGAAIASKVSAMLLLVPVVAVLAVRWRYDRQREGWVRTELAVSRLMFVAAIALITARLTVPDMFHDISWRMFFPSDRWIANLEELRGLSSGSADFPPGHQWTGRISLWFPWRNMALWGMGPALGFCATAGLLVACRRVLGGHSFRLLVPVLWAALIWIFHGTQWAMTMRYFLPSYGALAVLAAWLIRLGAQAVIRRTRFRRTANWLPAMVVALTFLWAVAFVQIYTRPNTRVQASHWIYENIPSGSGVAHEHWDDPLPLHLPGQAAPGDHFSSIEMRWYDADNPEKLRRALDWLDASEYIVLSSQRLYGSIPRLPARYPMTSAYYRALFDGRLGYEPVAKIRSEPSLFGISFSSEAAEEAFSVYDHAPVSIYRKTQGYSREHAGELLAVRNWDEVVDLPAGKLSASPTGLMLPKEGLGAVRPRPDEKPRRTGLVAVMIWLAWLAISAIAWPLITASFAGMPDHGYGLSRTLAIFCTAWAAWLAAGVWTDSYSRHSLIVVWCLLIVAGAGLGWKQRSRLATIIRKNRRSLAASEVVFWAALAFFGLLRCANPDLWHPHLGGEKPMDFAFLNAVLNSESVPPAHPWFAGGYINYYYFGFVVFAAPIKMFGIAPEIGYNLSLATIGALLAAGTFSVGSALAPRFGIVSGVAAATLTLLLGHLHQARILFDAVVEHGLDAVSRYAPSHWYFDATRPIGHAVGEAAPIVEFPLFSILYGDLHAHLMALPLLLVAMGIAAAWALGSTNAFHRTVLFISASWVIGAGWAINSWQMPVSAAIFGVALYSSLTRATTRFRAVWRTAGWLLCAVFLGRLFFWPFHKWFAPGYGGFELWRGSTTEFSDYLAVYGLLLVALALVLNSHFFGIGIGLSKVNTLNRLSGWAAAFVALVALALWTRNLLSLTIVGIAAALLWCSERPDCGPQRALSFRFAAVGFGLTLFSEWFVLTGDIARSNTVFKLSYQAWMLIGIAATALCADVWLTLPRRSKIGWAAVLGLILLASASYPVLAIPARAADQMDPDIEWTWDGMAFLDTSTYDYQGTKIPLAEDRALIEWLRRNAPSTSVIAEYNTFPHLYTWGNRMATFTGLQSVVGWDWHLRQQMVGFRPERVATRIKHLQEIYRTADAEEASRLLKKYGADYIVIGHLERAAVEPAGIEKFDLASGVYWTKVFAAGESAIYQVREIAR